MAASTVEAGMKALQQMRAGGKAGLARALARAESCPDDPATIALLDAAHRHGRGHVLGLTGTPGVGKSTLTNALIRRWRTGGESVGVIAVDPSSRRTGGALLGDRARISTDPDDEDVFVRSLAARDRLGGLSEFAIAAMVLMRAAYDRVILESVGIGQSEADIAFVADTVLLCIQPGGGDALQFMKAGVMELPHVVAVTKADMGPLAMKAKADVEGALSLSAREEGENAPPVILLSATRETGLDALDAAMSMHRAGMDAARHQAMRDAQARAWIDDAVGADYGRCGRMALAACGMALDAAAPFAAIAQAKEYLGERLGRASR